MWGVGRDMWSIEVALRYREDLWGTGEACGFRERNVGYRGGKWLLGRDEVCGESADPDKRHPCKAGLR